MSYTIGRGDFDGVAVFLAVAKTRGFRAAAAQLGITPSAVSQAMRAFEARLGVTLVARTTRSVGLTEAGERLLLQVRPGAVQVLQGIEAARSLGNSVTGLLRISVPKASVLMLTERFVAGFLVANPRMQLELVGDDKMADIIAEGCDAGVRPRSVLQPHMVAVPLTEEEPQVVIGAPVLMARHGMPAAPDDIKKMPCIVFRQAGVLLDEWMFTMDGTSITVPVSGPMILDDVAACIHAAEQGVGLFRLPRSLVARNIHAGTLSVVLDAFAVPFPGLALYYPSRHAMLPKLRAFVDHVVTQRM
jgi:DNA-binding transcriptional LysR family regulator